MKNANLFVALAVGCVLSAGAGELLSSSDSRIGALELRVWELTLETNANRQVHALDWNRNDQYQVASTRGQFSKLEEDGRSFLRIGEKGECLRARYTPDEALSRAVRIRLHVDD